MKRKAIIITLIIAGVMGMISGCGKEDKYEGISVSSMDFAEVNLKESPESYKQQEEIETIGKITDAATEESIDAMEEVESAKKSPKSIMDNDDESTTSRSVQMPELSPEIESVEHTLDIYNEMRQKAYEGYTKEDLKEMECDELARTYILVKYVIKAEKNGSKEFEKNVKKKIAEMYRDITPAEEADPEYQSYELTDTLDMAVFSFIRKMEREGGITDSAIEKLLGEM